MSFDDAHAAGGGSGGPPSRWLEGGAPPGVAMLLQSAPKPRPRTPVDLHRTTALVAKIGAKPVAAGILHTLFGKTVAAVALGAVIAGTTTAALRATSRSTDDPRVPLQVTEPAAPIAAPAPTLTPVPVLAPAPEIPAPPRALAANPHAFSPERKSAPALAPERSQSLAPEPAPASTLAAPEPPAVSRIAEEARILETARSSLATNPTAALRVVDEHATRFPTGALRTERELLRIEALVRAGRRDEAQNLRIAFLANHASVAHTRKLRAIFGETETNP